MAMAAPLPGCWSSEGCWVAGAFAVSGAVAVEQRVGRDVDGCAGDEPDRGGDGAAMADGLVDSGVYQ